MSSFSVDAKCQGSFVIDIQGTRSTEPVDLKSADWDGKTLKLVSNNSVNICNSFMSFNGNTFTSYSSGNSSVYINGVKIDPSCYNGNNKNSDAKMFSRTWEELKLVNPVLTSLDISGSADFSVKIPLDEDCDLDISGSGSINVYGDNLNTSLNATVTGSGDIKGDSKLKKLVAQVTGSGDIGGFCANKILKAKVTGSGDIKLYSSKDCNVDKKVTGSGEVRISQL